MPFATTYKTELLGAIEAIDLNAVERAIQLFEETRKAGRQVFVCGNGGSAATASHFACDVLKGTSSGQRARVRIIALTDSMPTVTAYANDTSFDFVFVEQLKSLANRGDLLVALSGSGNSRNVLRAMEYATVHGCGSIALTGRDGGRLGALAQLHINVADAHMGRIEDVHMVVCHMIAYALMEDTAGYPPAAIDATRKVTTRR